MKGSRLSREYAKRLLVNISLSLIVFLILFGVTEVACRLFYDESENYSNDAWERLQETISSGHVMGDEIYADPDTGLIYRLSDRKLDGDRYMFLDSGAGEKEDGVYRIAALGDSFTRCGGLTKAECEKHVYTRRLSKLLNSENEFYLEGIDEFEVLTFAEGGMNTYQELVLFKELVMSYSPDMLILQYTDNDIGPHRSELGHDRTGVYVYSRTSVLLLGDRMVPTLPYLDEGISWFLLSQSAFLRFVSYKLNIIILNDAEDVDISLDSVRELDELTGENNISFIIINFPPANKNYWNVNLQMDLRELAGELNVPFYNMRDYVVDIDSIGPDSEQEWSYHYNKEGHRIAAGVLKDAVIREISGDSGNPF
jgi:hypothetical protein